MSDFEDFDVEFAESFGKPLQLVVADERPSDNRKSKKRKRYVKMLPYLKSCLVRNYDKPVCDVCKKYNIDIVQAYNYRRTPEFRKAVEEYKKQETK